MQISSLEVLEGFRGVWWVVTNRQVGWAAVESNFAKSCGERVKAGAQPVKIMGMTPDGVTFWLDMS